MADLAKWTGAVEIPVELIEANPWNPNQMSDVMFEKLVKEIETTGFDEPIIVVPHPEQSGKYRVVNGEHRWKAVQHLKWTTVPVVIKELSEAEQKTMSVRRNLLHGDLDRVKFTELVNDVISNHGMPRADVPFAMGFTDEQEFFKNIVKEKTAQDKQIAEASKSATQIVDNVSYLLSEIFGQFGETVPQGFIFFMHKKKMHLMVQMDKDMEETVGLMVSDLKASGKSASEYLGTLISKHMLEVQAAQPAETPSTAPEGDVKY